MSQPGAILFDSIEAVRADSIAFDDWHGNDHAGELAGLLPGAVERRYTSAPRACMTSIIELGDRTPEPRLSPRAGLANVAAHHERFIAHPLSIRHGPQAGHWIEARIAYPVFFAVPDDQEKEFNAWYEEEHLEILFACKSWLACRRFRIAGTHPRAWTHLALHYLSDASALRSPERTAARSTPWRDRLSTQAWFQGDYRVLHRLA